MDPTSLPMLKEPADALRHGVSMLKDGTVKKHPVEELQRTGHAVERTNKLHMMKNIYGSGLPARMQIERQILERVGRLPGIPSSRIGLQAMTGELDEFGFDAYLNLPENAEMAPADLHSQMEARMGMGAATKPSSRPFF